MESMKDKTIVITGATSGIGFAAASDFAARGAFVIGTGRSEQKCREAEEKIRSTCEKAAITFLHADLSSLGQVRKLAEDIRGAIEKEGRTSLDVLVNNAGTVSSWFVSTAEGFELQFAVNHLAPFLLAHELLPLLREAPGGRIITVSSGSHYRTKINWDDVLMRKRYNCLMAYKQSKLANVLFTSELNRRLGKGSGIAAFALDPGLVNTGIGLKGTSGFVRWFWGKRSRGGKDPYAVAASMAFLATDVAAMDSGEPYWKDRRPRKPSRYAMCRAHAQRLWELSERMCGITSADFGL